MREEEITFTPAREDAVPIAMPDEPADEPAVVAAEGGPSRRKWILGGAIAGVVALVVASAVVIGIRQRSTPPVAPPVVRAPAVSAPVAAAPAVPLPSAPIVDSAAGVAGRPLDSTKAVVAEAPPQPR